MKALRLLSCLIVGFAVTACSNHWRESGSKLTAAELQSIIQEIEQSGSLAAGSGNISEALALKDDINASVYFAEGYKMTKDRRTPMGAVSNILGFFDFEFLGLGADVGFNSISEARVLLIDAPQENAPRKDALIIGMMMNGSWTYYAFNGSGEIYDGESFEAYLEGGAGQPIIVQSYDVNGGLDTVIQLKVYDSAGGYLGKIASLVGFKN